jgi:hypothetical protein
VQAFAEEQGVTTYLPAVLEATRRIYPEEPFQVILSDEPESTNDRQIVIQVLLQEWEMERVVAARQEWVRQVEDLCPSDRFGVFHQEWVTEW